jgi:hypothetical protein
MNIKEIITEEIVDEYRISGPVDIKNYIRHGNAFKDSMLFVKTPMDQYNVRYMENSIRGGNKIHDYFLYDKKTDRCIGLFTLEMVPLKLNKILQPGIKTVTPHMALAPEAQRQGISTQAYSTFLQGGPWVFVTDHHTKGASKLWDSLATGNNISLYVSAKTGELLDPAKHHEWTDLRLLGPRDRFKLDN